MTLVIGCKCGNGKFVSVEADKEYGQYYVIYECKDCGYYWEGVRFGPGQSA